MMPQNPEHWLPLWARVIAGPALPVGDYNAFAPLRTISTVDMACVKFNSPCPIHGLLLWEWIPTIPPLESIFFFYGYRCTGCGQIYLVPDSVNNQDSLYPALRHDCPKDKLCAIPQS